MPDILRCFSLRLRSLALCTSIAWQDALFASQLLSSVLRCRNTDSTSWFVADCYVRRCSGEPHRVYMASGIQESACCFGDALELNPRDYPIRLFLEFIFQSYRPCFDLFEFFPHAPSVLVRNRRTNRMQRTRASRGRFDVFRHSLLLGCRRGPLIRDVGHHLTLLCGVFRSPSATTSQPSRLPALPGLNPRYFVVPLTPKIPRSPRSSLSPCFIEMNLTVLLIVLFQFGHATG